MACARTTVALCRHQFGSPPTTLQVAVAQGDSLVHYEDGPNRTLQVRRLS